MTRRPSSYLISYRAIEEGLEIAEPRSLLAVVAENGRVERFVETARERGVKIERVSREELRRRAGSEARDCALLLHAQSSSVADLASLLENISAESAVILLLDHITDPHNLGAILRSADQFRIDAVVIPKRRSSAMSNVVMESSAGTAGRVPVVQVSNLAATIGPMRSSGFWVYAADMDGAPIHETSLTGKVAIIMGSEGSGVSRLLRDRADATIRIPARGHADSFNVSVACGIIVYEVRRQQRWFDL